MLSNEASAAESARTITTAEVVYNTTYGVGFSPTLVSLGGNPVNPDPTQAGLIDSVLSGGIKSGYVFSYAATTTDVNGNVLDYTVNADPTLPGTTGQRHFYTDQTGVIRQNASASAGPSDPPIQ